MAKKTAKKKHAKKTPTVELPDGEATEAPEPAEQTEPRADWRGPAQRFVVTAGTYQRHELPARVQEAVALLKMALR